MMEGGRKERKNDFARLTRILGDVRNERANRELPSAASTRRRDWGVLPRPPRPSALPQYFTSSFLHALSALALCGAVSPFYVAPFPLARHPGRSTTEIPRAASSRLAFLTPHISRPCTFLPSFDMLALFHLLVL